MPVFRVEKNSNYTTMCNYHLRDQGLSLKGKGLLSMLLSLPDTWNYSAQESIPFQRMFPDGICRVTDNYYTKTIQYQDINYQLAQQEDQTAIFEEWCSFLNFFDSSIRFELSFMNMATDASNFEKMVCIPYQKDHFNPVRTEYSTMLRRQLAQQRSGSMAKEEKCVSFRLCHRRQPYCKSI